MTETITVIKKDLPDITINMIHKDGSPHSMEASCHSLIVKMNMDKLA